MFIILKNADFTEGRGPMVFHRGFATREEAIQYLNTLTSGIYGAKPKKGESFSEYVIEDTETHKRGGWSGYKLYALNEDGEIIR